MGDDWVGNYSLKWSRVGEVSANGHGERSRGEFRDAQGFLFQVEAPVGPVGPVGPNDKSNTNNTGSTGSTSKVVIEFHKRHLTPRYTPSKPLRDLLVCLGDEERLDDVLAVLFEYCRMRGLVRPFTREKEHNTQGAATERPEEADWSAATSLAAATAAASLPPSQEDDSSPPHHNIVCNSDLRKLLGVTTVLFSDLRERLVRMKLLVQATEPGE